MLPLQVAGFSSSCRYGRSNHSEQEIQGRGEWFESMKRSLLIISLVLAFLLFGVGFLGVVIRRNLLLRPDVPGTDAEWNKRRSGCFFQGSLNLDGSIFVFFIMTVAAAEVAVGLALLVALYKKEKYFHRGHGSSRKLTKWKR